MGVSPFRVVDRTGNPSQLVSNYLDRRTERIACFVHPTSKALVLGSSQQTTSVKTDVVVKNNMQLCSRRSGGSSVIVAPQQQLWLDVFVPASDPLFQHDVCRATWWLGELWRESFVKAGVSRADLSVHHAGLKKSRFSDTICFLGQGPGEVFLGEKKIVGVSQRRDRTGTWFFTMAMKSFIGEEFVEIFGIEGDERDELLQQCKNNVTSLDELGLGVDVLRTTIADELRKI